MKKLLDHDPQSGVSHVFDYDDATNEVTITAAQEAEPITEFNKVQFNERPGRWGDGLQKVASIPNTVYAGLLASGKIKDQAYMRRWLNDPANRAFRTRPGKV